MFRCRFLAIVDVRTIYRYHMHAKNASAAKWCLKGRIALQAGHASPVKWCLNEKVELLCKVVFEKVLLGKWSAIAMLEHSQSNF